VAAEPGRRAVDFHTDSCATNLFAGRWSCHPAAALTYAETSSFDEPNVEPTTSDPLNLRIPAGNGLVIDLTMAQPERTGAGGIWAILDV
jgi:hypothetical protein